MTQRTIADDNFITLISLLNKNKIPYWLCHGTLLGIVRDQNLIPWDHDIDVAIFQDDVSKKYITNLLIANDFINRGGDLKQALHFKKDQGRFVDINFYELNEKKDLYVNFCRIPKNNLIIRMLYTLANNAEYNGKNLRIVSFLRLFRPLFYTLQSLLDIWNLTFELKGYTVPVELLKEFTSIKIDNMTIRVPVKSIEICKYTYGENWDQPIKNFDWEADSPSTKVFK